LILDYLDFPESLDMSALSEKPSWGIQVYSGSRIFENPNHAEVFREAVMKIKETAAGSHQAP